MKSHQCKLDNKTILIIHHDRASCYLNAPKARTKPEDKTGVRRRVGHGECDLAKHYALNWNCGTEAKHIAGPTSGAGVEKRSPQHLRKNVGEIYNFVIILEVFQILFIRYQEPTP